MHNLILTILILGLACPSFAAVIDYKEYPQPKDILPISSSENSKTISGNVEKTDNMDLNTCIWIALGNNPSISAAFQDILTADSKIKQAWSNYFPVFSWQTSYTHIKQLQLSDALGRNLQFDYYLLGQITLQQMLYDFGVTQNSATINRLEYKALKKNFESIVNDVIYQTKEAYYNVLYAYKNKETAKSSVDRDELFYNQARAYYLTGKNPKVDLTIAQVNLSNSKLGYIQAENAVFSAIAKLNNVMGVPNLKEYKIDDELKYVSADITFEDSVQIARSCRPELKKAELYVEQARQKVQLAKKSFYPQITVEGQYQRGGKSWLSNDGFNIGGFLIFPSINLMYVKTQIDQAKYQYNKELANAKNVQNTVYYEIQQAYIQLNEKKSQIPVAQLNIKQAKENYELSSKRYKVGVGSASELKDAEAAYSDAQLILTTALYEYNVARAKLEMTIGKNISGTEIIALKND